jgi:hypothetical protein
MLSGTERFGSDLSIHATNIISAPANASEMKPYCLGLQK